MSKCASLNCRAEIEWGKLNGKPHPFDPPEPCRDCNGKGLIVVTAGLFGSTEMTDPVICGRCNGTGSCQKSHFSSCPDAPRFRKKADKSS